MVHEVIKVEGGYKVRDAKPPFKYYSLKPLTKTKARKQLIAISLSLLKKGKHKEFNK
jgi:hypothetical protein